MTREMAHSAQHDPVTNLPNRLLLNDGFSQSIALARRQHKPIAVIFLDLDRFKYINDSLGHATATSFFSPFQNDCWLLCAVPTRSAARVEMNS